MAGPPSARSARARLFVSWTPHPRADAIAQALGANVYCPSTGSRKWLAPPQSNRRA
jgi:hypothetical protein